MRDPTPQINKEKFKEVVLYVLHKLGGKEGVDGKTLHIALYFIDFDFYEKYEGHFVGLTYKKENKQ